MAGPAAGTQAPHRYCRQSLLPEIGQDGQRRLAAARAVVVGLGALGSSCADNLVRAGVGTVVLIDRDLIEIHNLQRQILYSEDDVGRPKAVVAGEILQRVNRSVNLQVEAKDFNLANAEKLLDGADIVLDGTDNLQTRFLINDVCTREGIPWIYGGAVGTVGMVMPVLPGRGPCFRCLVPAMPGPGVLQTCDIAGVLNTIPPVIASLECTLAYRILTGHEGDHDNGTASLVTIDAWRQTFDTIEVARRVDCPCCCEGRFEFLNSVAREMITSLCGRDAIQITPSAVMEISLEELQDRLLRLGEVRLTPYMLTFRSGKEEFSIFRDGRAIIKGTKDEAAARSLYARYVGL